MPEFRIDDLNPDQLRAATADEGPVLTIAGAGTGKKRLHQILATEDVVAQFAGQRFLFLSRGPIAPKGFDHAIQVYEVRWCDD